MSRAPAPVDVAGDPPPETLRLDLPLVHLPLWLRNHGQTAHRRLERDH